MSNFWPNNTKSLSSTSAICRSRGTMMAKPLRVFHIINTAASNRYFRSIAEYTDRDRFEILVGTLGPAGVLHKEMSTQGVGSLSLGCERRSQYAAAAARLAVWLRNQQIDIVQTHLFEASFVGLTAARLAGKPFTILTRHHSSAIALLRKRLPSLIDRICSKYLAHRVIALSQMTKRFLIDYEKVPPKRVIVVPLGYNFLELQPSSGARERIRTELALDGTVVLITVGRLDPLKGHDLLFTAFRDLVSIHPNLRLLVIGDGPEQHRLCQLRERFNLQKEIILTGHRWDVPDLLASADIYVHPSLSESFCQMLIEAAAVGKPIVSTDIGGARETIETGTTGIIVAPGSVEALREALLSLLRHPERIWREMGEAGRIRVQRFSAKRMVAAYEELYVRLAARRRNGKS